jgi:hypothetical protein
MSDDRPVSDEELARWSRWLRDAPTAIMGADRSAPSSMMLPRLVNSLQEARRRIAALEAVLDQAVGITDDVLT